MRQCDRHWSRQVLTALPSDGSTCTDAGEVNVTHYEDELVAVGKCYRFVQDRLRKRPVKQLGERSEGSLNRNRSTAFLKGGASLAVGIQRIFH